MAGIARTPEGQADTLEKLAGDPSALRERMESMLSSCLQMIEHDARYGAVVLRRIRDKELYRKAGWPTWAAFAEHWSPGAPQRFDTLVTALEVVEARGDERVFGEAEARKLATLRKRGRPKKGEDNGAAAPLSRGSNGVAYLTARLQRDDPALAEKVERGELTAREAAKQKGWVKKPGLAAAWNKASAEERAAFLAECGDELRRSVAARRGPPVPEPEPLPGHIEGAVAKLKNWLIDGSRLRATFKSGQVAALRAKECGVHPDPNGVDRLLEFLGVFYSTLTADEGQAE